MKKSFIILFGAAVVLATTFGFTVVSKDKTPEQVQAAQEPAMVKPIINEAQF